MPLIPTAYLSRPFYMLNAHWETIIPSLLNRHNDIQYDRERLELSDGDFLDLDWIRNDQKKCLIITHGLEGGSDRYYVKRTARYFSQFGWDIAAWNCRSCSGEINRLPRFYHHGDTPDLDVIVKRVLQEGYQSVVLFGYSMGGSLTLKYMGETSRDHRVKGAVAFSVPCHLKDSSDQLALKKNRFYERRFLKKLVDKINAKSAHHSEVEPTSVAELGTFEVFHDRYTGPLHGFSSKEEFFEKATCDQYFDGLQVPVLVVNALNDPMLGSLCYPSSFAQNSPYFHLETPQLGGHTGFSLSGKSYSYMEVRARWFIDHYLTLE